MQLIKCRYKLRCEISDCKSFADYTVYTKRTGVRNSLHLCKDCLLRLTELVKAEGIQGVQADGADNKPQAEEAVKVKPQEQRKVGGNGAKKARH